MSNSDSQRVDSEGITRLYRSWWMSDKIDGKRNDYQEVKEIIKIIKLAKDVVKKPIFLARSL
jgi:hypothetical protein